MPELHKIKLHPHAAEYGIKQCPFRISNAHVPQHLNIFLYRCCLHIYICVCVWLTTLNTYQHTSPHLPVFQQFLVCTLMCACVCHCVYVCKSNLYAMLLLASSCWQHVERMRLKCNEVAT